MRIAVYASVLGALGAADAGTAVARAWSRKGCEIAVVPWADAGAGAVAAWAQLHGVDVELTTIDDVAVPVTWARAGDTLVVGLAASLGEGWDPGASSAPLGRAVATAVAAHPDAGRLVVDLSGSGASDGGAGLRKDLRSAAEGRRLVGLLPVGERDVPLLGLRGISSTGAHVTGRGIDVALAADERLARVAGEWGITETEHLGGCGGLGLAVASVGGELVTIAELWPDAAVAALGQADVVVGVVEHFDFHARGGGAVDVLRERAAQTGTPLVIIAGDVVMGARELRSLDVDDAYPVGRPADAPALTAACEPIARTWSW